MKNQYEEPEKVQLDLNEFEVARSEFFAHMREPSFIFNDGKVGVNTACVRRLPEVDYVQFLINRKKQKLAVRVCQEEDIFSIPLAKTTKDGKRLPRSITGRMFFMKVCDMMGWNPDYRYKILGKLVKANGELLFLFDLTNIVINRLAASHSDIELAAIGIVQKVERFPLNIGIGICLGMIPLIGYNYASGNHRRMIGGTNDGQNKICAGCAFDG